MGVAAVGGGGALTITELGADVCAGGVVSGGGG